MKAMYQDIGEECSICNQLREKIDNAVLALQIHDLHFVDDYIYYPQEDKFERSTPGIVIFRIGNNNGMSRLPLKGFIETEFLNYDGTSFENFTLIHALMLTMPGGEDLMPTFMIIYKDDTYDLNPFIAEIKTTVYRKINEVADLIRSDDIKEVFLMMIYSCCEDTPNALDMTSKERKKIAQKELLACMKVDCNLNEMEYIFECDKATDVKYIVDCMQHGAKDHLEIGVNNLAPIINAFKTRKRS